MRVLSDFYKQKLIILQNLAFSSLAGTAGNAAGEETDEKADTSQEDTADGEVELDVIKILKTILFWRSFGFITTASGFFSSAWARIGWFLWLGEELCQRVSHFMNGVFQALHILVLLKTMTQVVYADGLNGLIKEESLEDADKSKHPTGFIYFH